MAIQVSAYAEQLVHEIAEQLVHEIKETPEEYLPILLKIVRLFRERKYLDNIIFIFAPRRPGEHRALQTLAWGFSLCPLCLCGEIVV